MRRFAASWVTGVVVAALAAPAAAQQDTQALAPSVAFTDTQPIRVTLGQLQSQGALRLQLTNLLTSEQPVTVSVVGLRPADGFSGRLFDNGGRILPPRASRIVRVPLVSTPSNPTAPSYEGRVVAVGARGPLVRLRLTITDTGAKVTDKPASPCAEADALRDVNQDDAATTAYKEVLKNNPSEECAEEALGDRTATEALRHWLDVTTGFGAVVLQWLALGAGALAVAVLVAGLFPKARAGLVRWRWLDRRLAPRLAVQEFGEDKKFAALVREELVREIAAPHYRLDRVTARDSVGKTLGTIEAVDPSLKTLGAILDAVEHLLPRARFTASGALHSKGSSGEGATVLLEGGRDTASATLWNDAATAESHHDLAVPVAAWIDYEVHSALEGPPGIGDARSYALLQGGLAAERRGDVETAERLYARAVDTDPANVAAIINLANLKARGRQKYLDAVAELHDAIDQLHVLQ